jgi:hypothetical protein
MWETSRSPHGGTKLRHTVLANPQTCWHCRRRDTGNVAEIPAFSPKLSHLALDQPRRASRKPKANPSETRFLSHALVLHPNKARASVRASAARSLSKVWAKDENGRQGRAYQLALRRRSCGSDASSLCARKRGRACLSRPIFCAFAPTSASGKPARRKDAMKASACASDPSALPGSACSIAWVRRWFASGHHLALAQALRGQRGAPRRVCRRRRRQSRHRCSGPEVAQRLLQCETNRQIVDRQQPHGLPYFPAEIQQS